MKLLQRVLIFSVILCLCGCGDKNSEESSQIYEYFPFSANVLYSYTSEDHALASYKIYNTIISDSRLQRLLAPEVETYSRQTEVFEVANGELRLINGDTYIYHYEDLTLQLPAKDMLLLKEPLTLGAKWNITDVDTAEVTGVDVTVDTPAGRFKTLEVTCLFSTGFTQRDYYAKGIGLVKTEYGSDTSSPITSILSEYTEKTDYIASYTHFSPDYATGDINISTGHIKITTNYILADIINSILFDPDEDGGHGAYLTSGTLTGMSLSPAMSSVTLTFNDGIYKQGYASFDEEYAALSSIALTVGNLVGADYVHINVDGKPYSGQFVQKTEDEYFIANLDLLSQAQSQ